MYASRYNIEANGTAGEHLLFNTANGAFAALDDAAHASYLRFATNNNSLRSELLAAGFLTELSPAQELQVQQQRFNAYRTSTDELALCIAPTYACNYRCPYCYEEGHNAIKSIMSPQVIEAIYAYIEQRSLTAPPARLFVQWYGGDPSLCLDVVRSMSQHLIAFCDEHSIIYDAMMLTNCNLIDEAAAQLLEDCRVSSVLVTIDGPEELHNARRVAADGSNSYQRNLQAMRLFRAHGIEVNANMNADKVNWETYPALKKTLWEEEGVHLGAGLLNDYGHFFGSCAFKEPEFNLFTHEEFAVAQHEEFRAAGFTAADLRARLQPAPYFCRGQNEGYLVIDALGDVYKCDGLMGDADHRQFNILDDPATWKLHEVTFDATHDETCSACNLLPICQGSCYWERACTGMPCHPLKTTIANYLQDYRACFEKPSCGFTLLAEPLG